MRRAQGILRRWKEETAKDPSVAPFEYLLDLQYKKYQSLCFWSYETPLSKGKWLFEKIKDPQADLTGSKTGTVS